MLEQQLEIQGFDFSQLGDKASGVQAKAREFKQWRRKTESEVLEWGAYFLDELRPLYGRHGNGFVEAIEEGFGIPVNNVYRWMKVVKQRRQEEFTLPYGKVEELPEQAQSKQDDEKDRKLAELEQTIRIANERLFSIEGQLAHYKQQALIAQSQAAQPPKTVEKRIEVVPQHILDHQRELQERLRSLQTEKAQLQTQAAQVKKERDLYKRDLDKERQGGNALFLQRLEQEGPARLRANFAEAMREIVAWSRASSMKLPSVVDAYVFKAEEWHRLEEAIAAHEVLGRELRKVKQSISSSPQQSPLIVDAEVEVYS